MKILYDSYGDLSLHTRYGELICKGLPSQIISARKKINEIYL